MSSPMTIVSPSLRVRTSMARFPSQSDAGHAELFHDPTRPPLAGTGKCTAFGPGSIPGRIASDRTGAPTELLESCSPGVPLLPKALVVALLRRLVHFSPYPVPTDDMSQV